ncbi:MAG: TIGR02647 family protein, partial [Marinobacter sp.]
VHASQAAPETVRAAASLFSKGLISQEDGGYLTPMGCEAVELTQKLQTMLASE